MTRFIVYLLLLVLLLSDSAFAARCSTERAFELFDQLQSTVPWVDISSQVCAYSCRLTIRYYPCSIQIEAMFANALLKMKPRCSVLWGSHTQIEGYCALQNVWLTC